MNRQKAIQKIIRKLARVVGLFVEVAKDGRYGQAREEQQELARMIRAAIEKDWEP